MPNKALQLTTKSGAPIVALLLGSTELNRYKSSTILSMKLIFRQILSYAILFLVGCTTVDNNPILGDVFAPEVTQERKEKWNNMVGSWYGSQGMKDGGTYSWIIRRNINGLYQLEGIITKPTGESEPQIEVGEWGVGGDVYFTIFKGWIFNGKIEPSDPSDPYNRDIYKIIKFDKNTIRYQHIFSGETFEMKKVADSFKMPAIDL